jgi:hypothetical protein
MLDVPVRKVTIFVSSPSDVMAERERAARVINRLQSRFRDYVNLVPIFFEDKKQYYTADKSFQEQIPDAGASDLVVSIFWAKLGSELAPDLFGTMSDGQPYPGGAVYELMRALEAKQQKHVPDILVYRKVANTSVSVTDSRLRHLMNAQLDDFEAFWQKWFVVREGHFRAGFQAFHRPDDFERLLEGHLRTWLHEQKLLGAELIWRIAERGSPFRGLEPFETEHADVFFGRNREVDRGRERLLDAAARGTACLFIVGPSGAGKSSLARAGLVMRLTQPGDIDGVDLIRFAVVRPGEAATPHRSLAQALFDEQALPELIKSDFPEPERLAAVFMGEASAAAAPILRTLDRLAADLKTDKDYDRPVQARLLLVIDQLEELFSGTITEATRLAFVRLIAALARSGRVFVITTLRSSSYGALAREPEIVALKDAAASLEIGVPGIEVLTEIVRLPAAAAGLVFEHRAGEHLDEVLLAAAGGNTDALPLLGFTLQWLFEHRKGERLTFAAYDQLGGLEGAIGRAAERAFERVDTDAQTALPQLLRSLAEPPRKGASLALRDMPLALAPEATPVRRLADALVNARVALVYGEGQNAMLRLAHEAVLRGWERGREITTKEQDFYRIREDVTRAEQRWRGTRRRDLLLTPGLPLAEARSLKVNYRSELPRELVHFIDVSTRREVWRKLRRYAVVAVSVAAIGYPIGIGVYNIWTERPPEEAVIDDQRSGTELPNIFGWGLRPGYFEAMRPETIRQVAEQAEGAIGQFASRTETSLEARHIQGAIFILFSHIYLKIGATALASEDARRAVSIFRHLAAEDRGITEWRSDVLESLGRLGVGLEKEDPQAAFVIYRLCVDIERALAARDPGNTEWSRELSLNLNSVGHLLKVQGDRAGALEAYRESLNVRRELANRDPSNPEWQTAVIITLSKLAEIGDDARERLSEALAILMRLKSENRLIREERWIDKFESDLTKLALTDRP